MAEILVEDGSVTTLNADYLRRVFDKYPASDEDGKRKLDEDDRLLMSINCSNREPEDTHFGREFIWVTKGDGNYYVIIPSLKDVTIPRDCEIYSIDYWCQKTQESVINLIPDTPIVCKAGDSFGHKAFGRSFRLDHPGRFDI